MRFEHLTKIRAEETTGEQTVLCVLCREREAEFELDTERGFDLVCLSCSESELGGVV